MLSKLTTYWPVAAWKQRMSIRLMSRVPSLEVAYTWHATKFTREVLDGLLWISFLPHHLGQGTINRLIAGRGMARLTRWSL